MNKNFLLLLLGLAFIACKDNPQKKDLDTNEAYEYTELDQQARQFFGTLPKTADNPDTPLLAEKVALGKTLYFDTRLSKDNTQSCNTCHNLNTYGVDNEAFSEGNDGVLGGRNSPTTLNAALHLAQFWDGREPDVEAQSGGPILNPVEMAMPDEATVVKRLSKIEEYVALFSKAYPDQENPITYENLKTAIGAFERKLITPSKFDDYIAGNNLALSNQEKDGIQAFIDAGCVTCHSGSLLGGQMYQKFGLFGDYWEHTKSEKIDNGRFDVTHSEGDKFMFKVPSLRNIEKTGPYFHDGSISDLGEAIRIMAKTQVNKDLTQEQVDQIIVFLNTLTGEIPKELIEQKIASL